MTVEVYVSAKLYRIVKDMVMGSKLILTLRKAILKSLQKAH